MTNIRYADNLMIFAFIECELVVMLEILFDEFVRVGLEINASKCKIIVSEFILENRFIDGNWDFIEVLLSSASHTYFGRKIVGLIACRAEVEFSHRV